MTFQDKYLWPYYALIMLYIEKYDFIFLGESNLVLYIKILIYIVFIFHRVPHTSCFNCFKLQPFTYNQTKQWIELITFGS